MSTIAALELGLTLLPKITTGITEFVSWIASLKSALQQTGEWTSEYDAQWRAALLSQNIDPIEQPDK